MLFEFKIIHSMPPWEPYRRGSDSTWSTVNTGIKRSAAFTGIVPELSPPGLVGDKSSGFIIQG